MVKMSNLSSYPEDTPIITALAAAAASPTASRTVPVPFCPMNHQQGEKISAFPPTTPLSTQYAIVPIALNVPLKYSLRCSSTHTNM